MHDPTALTRSTPTLPEVVEEARWVLEPEEFKQGVPVILGHRLSFKQWQAFQLYALGVPNGQIWRQIGVSKPWVWRWMQTDWWAELCRKHFQDTQGYVLTRLSKLAPKLMDAVEEIIDGKRTEDRSVQAVVHVLSRWMEAGKNPLIDKRSINVNQSFNVDKAQFNVNVVKQMSGEELLEFARTGIRPGQLEEHGIEGAEELALQNGAGGSGQDQGVQGAGGAGEGEAGEAEAVLGGESK